jgi:TetR/AcrR family transcriptional regulator
VPGRAIRSWSSNGVVDRVVVDRFEAGHLSSPGAPTLAQHAVRVLSIVAVETSTATRRIGSEDSATRSALLDAAQRLLLDEGYAAVTSRRVAARAGLKPQLVHYYFRTMDDLLLAVVRRGAEQNLARQAEALASPRPLHALWELGNDPAGTLVTVELFALANHRKALRAELAAYAERFRRQQVEALAEPLAEALTGAGLDRDDLPPEAAMVLLTSISRVLVMEEALGVTTGHGDMRAAVERLLDRVEA